MKMPLPVCQFILYGVIALLFVAPSSAQDKPNRKPNNKRTAEAPAREFVSSEMRSGGKVVKGAPYSAEAVTESLQTLANGTKLAQKTTAMVYRDSEGRTRREQSAATIGPFGTAGQTPRVIFINDPVAGVAYTLYPDSRTGYKVAIPRAKVVIEPGQKPKPERGEERPNNKPPKPERPGKPDGAGQIEHPSFLPDNANSESRMESLGKRTVEGFQADGERTTIIIPINQIGNDKPIEIIEERWKSPELRTTLWSKTSDPRWGETTYKLININRAEPDRSLFVVPGDYTIEEGRGAGGKRRASPKQ
jgi:hypothetical protein